MSIFIYSLAHVAPVKGPFEPNFHPALRGLSFTREIKAIRLFTRRADTFGVAGEKPASFDQFAGGVPMHRLNGQCFAKRKEHRIKKRRKALAGWKARSLVNSHWQQSLYGRPELIGTARSYFYAGRVTQ